MRIAFIREERDGVGGFLLPLRTAKLFASCGEPMHSFFGTSSFFRGYRRFVGHHSVVSLAVQLRELVGGVRRVLGFANTSLYLFPVGHELGLYQWQALQARIIGAPGCGRVSGLPRRPAPEAHYEENAGT